LKAGIWSDTPNLFDFEKSRDDYGYRWFVLREAFKNIGIDLEIFTSRTNLESFHFILENNIQGFNHTSKYLLMIESPLICPENWDEEKHLQYRKIFSWDDGLIDNKKYFKHNLGHRIPKSIPKYFEGKKLCCIIAGHKKSKTANADELYSHRVQFIRWFEKNHPNDFDLYGTNWDQFRFGHSMVARFLNKFKFLRKNNQFPSYRGTVESKFQTMKEYKFSICYENIKDTNGYISEKIFDSFAAGCVPIYWGSRSVRNYIPKECFIDKREFGSFDDVFKYISTMKKEEYFDYLNNIEAFLNSEASKVFSAETFANTIVDTITKDLNDYC